MSGSSEFRDSVVVEPFEDQFVATIRGEYVREAGLEYYVRVENSGVFSTDPPRAPVDSVYSRDVEQPYAIFSSPVPNLGTDFLEGLDVKVQVSLPDGAVFGNGYVFYRAGGETVYNSVIIGPGDPAPFAVIPDSVTGSTGIEYWALVHTLTRTLTDPASDPAGSPYAIRITTPNLAETRSHAGNQFRMLSIPLDIEAPITGIVTDDLGGPDPTRWRMFAYDPGRYVELPSESITQFEQGRAYWLISREPHRLDTSPATGVSTPTDTPFEIELQPGWNLLGDPFNFSVTWDSCVVDTMTMANAEGAVVEPPVTWNGTGYSHGTRTLKPFGGCWVKNLADSAVTLLIPPISADGATPQILAAEYIAGDNNWFIEIVARCGDREDAYNIAGIAEGADNNWDRNDRSEPPASPGGGVSMYFPHDDWTYHPGNYTVDMRGDYQPIEKSMLSRVAHDNTMWGHTWWFDVAATSDAEVALDFTPVNLPAEAIAYVVDISSGTTVDLLSQPRYIFYTGDKTSQFALLVGSEEFVEESRDQLPGPPTQTVLHQNVPNPFNPTTTIRYELATASHVDLRVYDVSGALVRVLEDRDLPVGRYEAVWTGENDTGQRVSSGVYFYRLTADGAVTTRKMLLLK
jgi:hypothetical protein